MKGRLLGGRYLLEKPIGEGGMGIVYRARDNTTDQVVAVKIIREHIACETRAVKRFLREAEAAGRLNHPGIVRIFDEGTDVEHYLVMEYVEGVTIREWVRTFGRSWRPIVLLLGEVLGALYHAHSRGIIHRDIKPENIVVTTDRHAKLMDFGLARPLTSPGATITQSGAIVGTVAYMSPEQAGGKRGDERSDLYSLGVVAYELLTGKRPFSGDSPMQTLLKHIQEDPMPPRRHNPGLPEALEDVILRLLCKKPDERFASAAEAWEAFYACVQAPAAPAPSRRPQPEVVPAPTPARRTAVVTREPRPLAGARASMPRPASVLPKQRRTPAQSPESLPPVEVTVLYTKVQEFKQILEDCHPLEHFDQVGLYQKTVESIAQLTRGRVLDGRGPLQILVYDGADLENPATQAMMAVQRLKEEVGELAMRSSGSGDKPPDLFLSAGIFTRVLHPPANGPIDEVIRLEMLHGARMMHTLSASERRYCIVCENTYRRLDDSVEVVPVKSRYVAGEEKPIQAFETKVKAG